jgi:hypothetical protein
MDINTVILSLDRLMMIDLSKKQSSIVWGYIMEWGMGRLHQIDGIMCGPDYVKILDKDYLGTLKDLKIR